MEEALIEVTPRATKLVAEHFKDKKKRRPIRLFVKLGGCGIRSFGIALEKPTESDAVFTIDGFQYIIDKKLLEKVAPVKVDSDGFGFRISGSGVAPQHGCGNCGFVCGDGNRCLGDCAACTHKCGHGIRLMKKENQSN
jgi:iron-sulfur cluster assembly protein